MTRDEAIVYAADRVRHNLGEVSPNAGILRLDAPGGTPAHTKNREACEILRFGDEPIREIARGRFGKIRTVAPVTLDDGVTIMQRSRGVRRAG